jgi:hypothetical protein
MNDQLLADGAIARALSISPVTIRKQRFDRRHGRPHWFTVDPVMIGSVPRYRASEVLAWIQAQTDGRACGISTSGGAQ